MTHTDPPPVPPAGPDGRRPPPLAHLVGRRPKQGAVVAAKTVIDDIQALLRAEIALAKAEIADGVKAKVMGAGFFIAVAVIGWLAIQVFLVFLGFLFALFLPGWAAVGLVLLLMLIAMGVLGFLGYKKMTAAGLSMETTKATVEESKAATTAAVDEAKAHTKEGVEEAKVAVNAAVQDIKQRVEERVDERRNGGPTTTPPVGSVRPTADVSSGIGAPAIPMRTPPHPSPAGSPTPASATAPPVTPPANPANPNPEGPPS